MPGVEPGALAFRGEGNGVLNHFATAPVWSGAVKGRGLLEFIKGLGWAFGGRGLRVQLCEDFLVFLGFLICCGL